jgi:hypothetical protein
MQRLTAVLIVVVGAAIAKAGPVLPTFTASNFAAGGVIDNPYLPFVPGTTFRETANVTDPDTGSTGFQVDQQTVTFQTRRIDGVSSRIVHATSTLDNVLIEDTRDYYAQDKTGNVWYMGEDTKAFEYDDNGKLISTDTSGSWLAGKNGAKPGIIMPADRTVGFSYYQEFSPKDEAEDQAKIVSTSESVTVPVGSFTNVIKTEETTAFEPGVVENKFYARGVGEIQVFEDIQSNGEPLNVFRLESVTKAASVPLPAALVPGAVGFAALGLVCKKGMSRSQR